MKILFLSFTCEDIGVAMVTNMISQLQESFPLRPGAGSFEISFTKWLRGAKTVQLPVTFSMSCQIFTPILFPELEEHSGRFAGKNSCVLYRNFVSIYKINRTLHGRLGIPILSSRAESISHSFSSLTCERYFQHSKIKFVSPPRPCNILYLVYTHSVILVI